MSAEEPRPRTAAGLACLDGAPAPAGLAEDLQALGELPDAAQQALWAVIDAALPEPVPAQVEHVIERFASAHGVQPSAVARPASAVRALFRFATGADLAAEALRDDVRGLLGAGCEPLLALVSGWYEPARVRIQSELLSRTVAAHGKVLSDIEWRIETISASNLGRGFRLPMVTLTLRYLEDGKASAITLHALPSVLKKVKDTLLKLVS